MAIKCGTPYPETKKMASLSAFKRNGENALMQSYWLYFDDKYALLSYLYECYVSVLVFLPTLERKYF